MARPYTQKKRAERQAETRRRIVEAAVELHSTLGPARTTVSLVAERAGVQRHTYYAHFPEERSLFQACSGLALERDPLPDAADWEGIADPEERLKAGLGAVYAWYARNEAMTACVLRDAEQHELTRETVALRFGPPMAALQETLGESLDAQQRALLALAISFFTWRTLVRENGLEPAEAIGLLIRTIRLGGAEAGG